MSRDLQRIYISLLKDKYKVAKVYLLHGWDRYTCSVFIMNPNGHHEYSYYIIRR